MNIEYYGQCDKVRQTEQGEELWQHLMRHYEYVSIVEFLSIVRITDIRAAGLLEEDEHLSEWMQEDPGLYFATGRANGRDYYWIGHSGFEFFWREIKCVTNTEENFIPERTGTNTYSKDAGI